MKFKKAKPASREGLDANSTITRALATRLIAAEIAEPGAQPASVRNRVSHRISRAIKRGTLHEQSPGTFRFGALAAWAMDTWRGKFSDWPASRTVSPGTGRIVSDKYVVTLGMVPSVSGPDAEQVRSENKELRAKLEEATQREQKLLAELELLRPYKVKHDDTRAKRQAAGRRGGRGKSRDK